jgi:ureidoacrylate peracid hydrolase
LHRYVMPAHVKDRVVSRMGRHFAEDAVEAGRTALLVVDMQNYFVAQGHPAEVPMARQIVPAINRMASAVRRAGGTVVWIQTTKTGAIEHWRNFQARMLTPARQEARLAGLDELAEGYRIFPELEVLPTDMRAKKIKYSAFISHSSDLDAQLRRRGIDTVLVAGTLTNVCCESTARDAMMLDYRVAMLSDANATLSDEEHAATLNTFAMFFGDVVTVDEAIARLQPVAAAKSA